MYKQEVDKITLYLTRTLAEYEVIPAFFGWHIHLGDKYCGRLEYQQGKGWQGDALNHFSTKTRDKLKKFPLLDS
jgi:hypothetical protein